MTDEEVDSLTLPQAKAALKDVLALNKKTALSHFDLKGRCNALEATVADIKRKNGELEAQIADYKKRLGE